MISTARIHFYTVLNYSAMPQDLSLNGNNKDASIGSYHYEMPCSEFENLWDNLIYDSNIKQEVFFKFKQIFFSSNLIIK